MESSMTSVPVMQRGGKVKVVRSEADDMTMATVEAHGRYRAVDAPNSSMRLIDLYPAQFGGKA